MKKFAKHSATGKHGMKFPVFQFVGEAKGIKKSTPSAFKAKEAQPSKYSQLIAYYVAEAAANEKFLLEKNEDDDTRNEVATILLFYRAEDHVERLTAKRSEKPMVKTESKHGTSFEEQYAFYRGLPTWIRADFAQSIMEKHFEPFMDYFEDVEYIQLDFCIFPNEKGIAKLKEEWPDIAKEFRL